jgi:hypothetical protein
VYIIKTNCARILRISFIQSKINKNKNPKAEKTNMNTDTVMHTPDLN